MTSGIIYHDFQKSNQVALNEKTTTVLTERVLRKGKRWHRFWDNLNKVIEGTCLVVCGVGIAFSLYVLAAVL